MQRVADRAARVDAAPPLDLRGVPVLLAPLDKVRACTVDPRARWIAPFIDGVATVERVIADSALLEDDARAGLELLIDDALVALL